MLGDRTLFTDADGIEHLWAASSELLDDPPPLHRYAPASYGPQKMHELIAPRRWWLPVTYADVDPSPIRARPRSPLIGGAGLGELAVDHRVVLTEDVLSPHTQHWCHRGSYSTYSREIRPHRQSDLKWSESARELDHAVAVLERAKTQAT